MAVLPDNLPPPDWQDDEFGVALYCADCMDVLPNLPKVDCAITDPPYGIGVYKSGTMGGGVLAKQSTYAPTSWDMQPASREQIQAMIDVSEIQMIFGGNYFDLPPSRCWLVWDKETGGNYFADAELIWTNMDGAVRLIRHRWQGMLRKDEGRTPRVHPTQKPIGVMEWCIGHLPDTAQTILDPFMGSGTTGVACVNLDRAFIGIEKERKYFDISVQRIREAIIKKQNGPLFATHKPAQATMFREG